MVYQEKLDVRERQKKEKDKKKSVKKVKDKQGNTCRSLLLMKYNSLAVDSCSYQSTFASIQIKMIF